MIRRPPRSTPLYSSAASDVYKRQLWFTVRVLEWALDLEKLENASRGRAPDALLLRTFPGAYGLLGGKENQIFYPRFRVPEQIINDWVPTGLGACAAKMGMTAEGPWARRAGK